MTQISSSTYYAATTKWLQTPSGVRKLFLAPAVKTIDWQKVLQGSCSSTSKHSRQLLSRLSYLTKLVDFPRKWGGFIRSVQTIKGSNTYLERAEKGVFAFKNGASLTKTGAVGANLLHEVSLISLTGSQLALIKTVGAIAALGSFLKAGIEIKNISCRLTELKPGTPNQKYAYIQLARKVSQLIASFLSLFFFTVGGAAPLAVLILSTSILALTISKYYYKEIYLN